MSAWKVGFIFSGLWCLCLLTGCSGGIASASRNTASTSMLAAVGAPAAPPEVFDAVPLSGVGSGMVTIETDLPADINVVAFPFNEVALDYISQGWSKDNSDEAAKAEAQKNISVTLQPVAGGALIWARPLTPDTNPRDNVKLHVRVPRGASLVIKATKGGSITVSGDLASVHTHTSGGAIDVKGATGALQLATENGSISVDCAAQGPVQHLELHALNGDINIFGVGTNVLASTTAGNIRFVGSLNGQDNVFSTNGDGRILIALPDNVSYQFQADGYARVFNDFLPTSLICAEAIGGNLAQSSSLSPAHLGQIVASDPIITPTFTYKSVAGRYLSGNQPERPFLYFKTNHTQLVRVSPDSDVGLNGGNAAAGWWSPECDALKQRFAQQSEVGLRVSAERGEVLLRLIRKH
jgi:hypothetical protein